MKNEEKTHGIAERIIKYVIAFVGLSLGIAFGIQIAFYAREHLDINLHPMVYLIGFPTILGILFGLIFYFFSKGAIHFGKRFANYVQSEVEKLPPQELIFGLVGLIAGMLVAFLVSSLYDIIPIPVVGQALKILTFIFFGYMGILLAQKNLKDPGKIFDFTKRSKSPSGGKVVAPVNEAMPKILDTSVIIDGRIADICRTGFIEGTLIIPEFVLGELRHIADSADGLKRNRGRRGLDILQLLQKEVPVNVKIVEINFDDVPEVDVKLIKLAQKINGCILTNDYNLNKVATLQEIPILNINELANAVKPVVLPGEEMTVHIVKEGKEYNQGVSYLDDGTMIVVEDGRQHMGETVHVVVTSVLQTAAGRMIFARCKTV